VLADVLANRTYWVLVSAKPELWAVTHATGLKKSIPSYISGTRLLIPDQAAGQAYLRSLRSPVSKIVTKGITAFSEYSEEEKMNATLSPNDDATH
jgi:hypothetical protein